jgi:ParB/RepB/Spo0J family partition protein
MPENTTKTNSQIPLTLVALADLHPCPFNRPERSGFDDKSIAELAGSIKEQGIIEPLIVRKRDKGGFEIVCGERRWTAAKLAKLANAPCIVRADLDDNAARKLQIIENLQREGLHPVEEARGYADLLAQKDAKGAPVNTIESIAKDIGKSPAFVYGRVKLLRMPKVALEASFIDKLSASNALLIARIPDPKLARKAALEILDPFGTGEEDAREKRALDPEVEAMSYRKAKDHIQSNYMVRLKGSPFDQEDPELVPAELLNGERVCGGKCSDCPLRTGNMRALFQDVDSADVCTNTTCFKRKKDAAWKRASEKAKSQGHTLLRDGKASQLFHNGDLSIHQSDYVDVRGAFPGKRNKTWEQVLGEHLPDNLVQARDDKRKLHFLIPMDAAREAARKAGSTLPKEFGTNGRNGNGRYDPEEAKREEAARQKKVERSQAIAAAAAGAVFAKAKETKPTANWWRWLLTKALDGREHTWVPRFGCESEKALAQRIEKAGEDEARAMLVVVMLLERPTDWQGELSDDLREACDFYKVDLKKIAADKTAEFKAAEKAEADKAKVLADTKPGVESALPRKS